jgi:8-amino-7-oxononanoate synthase
MFEKGLRDLGRRELLRVVLSRESATGPEIVLEGRRYVNFSSNDYLGLANHPAITGAAIAAIKDYGFGSGASRLLAGGTSLHRELEERIAGYKQTEAARIFNSGYAANTGMIPALSSEGDVIFSDERNHASVVDGCRLSRAQTVIYPHGDVSRLEQLMKRHRWGRKMVITDTVFSMDGDIAPLSDLASLCRNRNALLYLDDAHGTGVLGQGKGALAHFDIAPESWMLQMGTFSKAFGSFGAFGAGAEEIIQWVSNTARSLLFSTALPAAAAAAALAALDLAGNTPSLVGKLWRNRRRLAEGLEALGYDTMASETPIIPVRVASIAGAVRLSRFLFEGGVYAPAIRPPTVKEPRIRITVSAAHTDKQIKKLLMLMKRWREGG